MSIKGRSVGDLGILWDLHCDVILAGNCRDLSRCGHVQRFNACHKKFYWCPRPSIPIEPGSSHMPVIVPFDLSANVKISSELAAFSTSEGDGLRQGVD